MQDRDFEMRRFALQKALDRAMGVAGFNPMLLQTPHDITAVAEIFYEFLKGEDK